jgi:glycosyltransferase involved in cell wall biosynthesis
VPYQSKSFIHRINRKIRRVLNEASIPISLITNRQPNGKDFNHWPVSSPSANTKNIYEALSKVYPTCLYHLTERVKIRFNDDDIFLGHPFFPHKPNGKGVTEFAVSSKVKPRALAIITPLHCDININTTHINKAFLDHVNSLMPHVDVLFAIMGQYWWDQWDQSPYAHWKSKMVRLDMAVDVKYYPLIKKKFNKLGKRKFLYIGKNDPMKGVDFLSKLAFELKNYEFGWIGVGADIPGVKRISGPRQLDPEYMSKVAEDYDFFISPSLADPNPTTILESMAWGFPVICTPQSGYYETEYIRNIYRNDFTKSVKIIRALQDLNEIELFKWSKLARRVVENDYNWGRFTGTILNHISLLYK